MPHVRLLWRNASPVALLFPRSALGLVETLCSLPLETPCEEGDWASHEFGRARLRDARLTMRLVCLAQQAVLRPSGSVTQIASPCAADIDAAYDFFENPRVSANAITLAHHTATAERCRGFPFVFLAVDGSSFAFPDAEGAGRIGSNKAGAKGLKTMLALAICPSGVPLGLLGQRLWSRPDKSKKHRDSRKLHEKETTYWHDVLQQAHDVLSTHAPGLKFWAQLDREGDSWTLVMRAVEQSEAHWTTIRARANRNLVEDPDQQDETEPGGKLFDALDKADLQAIWTMNVTAGAGRQARAARMHLKWVEVTLKLRDKSSGQHHPASVFALLVEEVGTTPAGEKPLRWLLLTTYPIETVEDACLVVFGYSLRWRIEGLHAALKDRGCRLEDSELKTSDNLERFLALMFAVGVRLMRLTYLGRSCPEQLATAELSMSEVQGLLLAHERDPEQASSLKMGEAVLLVGQLGGYRGNPKSRPIGFKVLRRGLQELGPWVRMVERGILDRLRTNPQNFPTGSHQP